MARKKRKSTAVYKKKDDGLRIYLNKTVFDAALDRIRYLFSEFENIVVGFSGGKDSTVCFNLTMMVAREMGRLPLKVMFIDQEAEWEGTIKTVERVMTHKDVEPYWLQVPMVITNNASSFDRYNHCWDPDRKDEWIHPQHPLSIKENTYGTERFHDLFTRFISIQFEDQKTALIGGVRTQESPKRLVGLTQHPTYKWVTWGKQFTKRHFVFYPIYDWKSHDIWKAIHDNRWHYNPVYDGLYRHGVTLKDMRISNLHHETALQNLLLIQEIEPQTWDKIAHRIAGANTIKHLRLKSFSRPDVLPFMFESWGEYCYYLIDKIIQEEDNKIAMLRKLRSFEKRYTHEAIREDMYKVAINTILSSDWDFTKMANFSCQAPVFVYLKWKNRPDFRPGGSPSLLKYIPVEALPNG